ncbi:MAG: biotin synthase BioB [Syntrophobacteraceae bacterium]|jgi:biotin synthase
MQTQELRAIREAAENDQPLSAELALCVLRSSAADLPGIFAAASTVRHRYFGNAIRLCSILNAQSGACSEDCAFCAQSSCHDTQIQTTPLCSKEGMANAFEEATELPVTHFGVVTSGGALSGHGIERVCSAVRENRHARVDWCASLGCLDFEQLCALKEAGVKRFHHNLESAQSFFPQICTTHSWEKRLETLRNARKAGLEVCSGGIFGLGESLEQRVEFALTLEGEAVDSIPLNFLVPIPGTRLEGMETMKPLDILRIISMVRLTNPRAEIKVCAGRVHLGDLQSMIFHAGANSMMIGHLLTVAGGEVDRDLQMLRDLEVEYAF